MKTLRTVQLLAVVLCAAAVVPTFAADGDLDVAWTLNFGSSDDQGLGLAIQADGKIVVVGSSLDIPPGDWDMAVVRFTSGSPDSTFSPPDGMAKIAVGPGDDVAEAVEIQPDGKIVMAGSVNDGTDYNFGVIRLNADGSLDPSFGSGGKVDTPVRPLCADVGNDMLLQSDGKIVLTGYSSGGAGDTRVGLLRYNPDGSLDSTFGSGGVTNTLIGGESSYGNAIAIQADGKLVVAGSAKTAGVHDIAVVRYNTDGSLDTSFDTDGAATTAIGSGADVARAVAIQPDGKILIAGSSHNGSNNDFAMVRYETDGSLDTSFGTGGKVTYAVGSGDDVANDLYVQPDGRIIVIGSSYNDGAGFELDAAVARFLPDGSVDQSFGTSGVVTVHWSLGDAGYAAAVQLDGKLVVAGAVEIGGCCGRDFLLLRLYAFETILFEDFEHDYGNGDSITNYHGWQGDGLAVATSSAAHSGTLGGYVPWGSSVSNSHAVGATNQVWTDLYARMHFREAGDAPSVGAGETAVFYFDTNGYATVYDGESNDWLTVTNDAAGNAATPVSTGDWVRVSVLQNYQSKKWALMLDDHVYADQLGFADGSVSASSAFATENTRHFDDLSIAQDYPRSLSGDNTDGDGLRDVWELHYMDTIAYGPLDDFDGDRAPNIVEQNAGTDPTDPNSLPDHPGTIIRLR